MALPQVLKRALPWVLILATGGCGSGLRQYIKPGYAPPGSVAVLPLNNHTTDMAAPDAVRFWLNQRLSEKKGYHTLPPETIDARLKELGVTEGGQLPALTPSKIGEALGTEAVIYGDILEFAYQTTGFLNVKKVHGRFKMVDCRTGEILWEGEGLGAEGEGATSPSGALQMGLKAVGTQLAERALKNPLRTQILDMVWNAIEYLPPAH